MSNLIPFVPITIVLMLISGPKTDALKCYEYNEEGRKGDLVHCPADQRGCSLTSIYNETTDDFFFVGGCSKCTSKPLTLTEISEISDACCSEDACNDIENPGRELEAIKCNTYHWIEHHKMNELLCPIATSMCGFDKYRVLDTGNVTYWSSCISRERCERNGITKADQCVQLYSTESDQLTRYMASIGEKGAMTHTICCCDEDDCDVEMKKVEEKTADEVPLKCYQLVNATNFRETSKYCMDDEAVCSYQFKKKLTAVGQPIVIPQLGGCTEKAATTCNDGRDGCYYSRKGNEVDFNCCCMTDDCNEPNTFTAMIDEEYRQFKETVANDEEERGKEDEEKKKNGSDETENNEAPTTADKEKEPTKSSSGVVTLFVIAAIATICTAVILLAVSKGWTDPLLIRLNLKRQLPSISQSNPNYICNSITVSPIAADQYRVENVVVPVV